jgi:hypothetical protein
VAGHQGLCQEALPAEERMTSTSSCQFVPRSTNHLAKSEKCNPCVRYEMSPMSRAAHYLTDRLVDTLLWALRNCPGICPGAAFNRDRQGSLLSAAPSGSRWRVLNGHYF